MLNQLTIKEAHEKIKAKEVSSKELTQACLDRIEATEDKITALLAKNFEGALEAAEAIDKRIAGGEEITPLMGIPNTIKDILITDGIETTAASNMLKGYIPQFDATVVSKLKNAGGVMLAKNNLDAWALCQKVCIE